MSPLSLDLRRRIIQAWQAEKLRVPELATRFSVGTATVKRLIRRFRETGSMEPRPHGGGQRPKVPAEKLPRVQRCGFRSFVNAKIQSIVNSRIGPS